MFQFFIIHIIIIIKGKKVNTGTTHEGPQGVAEV